MMSSPLIRKTIPQAILVICIMVLIVGYYFPGSGLSEPSKTLISWTTVIMAVAFWMGAVSVIVMYSRNIVNKTAGWHWSVLVIVMEVGTIVLGIVFGLNHDLYTSWVSATVSNFSVLLYAMMVPFLFLAGYKAFRVRNWESGFLVGVLAITYIGQSPAGGALVPVTAAMRDFIMSSIATGTGRAILLAEAFGAVVLGIRTIIGKEVGLLGRFLEEEAKESG